MLDRLPPRALIARHGHAAPYAAVVLGGGYEEAGDGGRFRVGAGDVLIHGAFSRHLDRDATPGAVVLNLPLPMSWIGASARATVDDVDALARLAERDVRAAGVLVRAAMKPMEATPLEEIDLLGVRLSEREPPRLEDWVGARMDRTTAWRRFQAAYGVSPTRYRVEARARRAWRRLMEGADRLADIAALEGYADQAHLTRDLGALTGRTPGQWRAMQHSFKTAPA